MASRRILKELEELERDPPSSCTTDHDQAGDPDIHLKNVGHIFRLVKSIGFFGPAIALFGLTTAKSPALASAWLSLAVGLKAFSHSGFLVNIQEIAPQYTGVLHGLANTAGTFAAILGTVGAGYFVELVGSFRGFLWLTSFLYVIAALFWNQFSTGKQVNFDETDS